MRLRLPRFRLPRFRLPRFLRRHHPAWCLWFSGVIGGSEAEMRVWIDEASDAPSYRVRIGAATYNFPLFHAQIAGIVKIQDIEEGSGCVVIERRDGEFHPHVGVAWSGASKTLQFELYEAAAEMILELKKKEPAYA